MNNTQEPKTTAPLITVSWTEGGGVLYEVKVSEASLELTHDGCSGIWISSDVASQGTQDYLRAMLLRLAEKSLKELRR